MFVSISWIAKATVQAAIGPTALDMAQKSSNPDENNIKNGETVLMLAVLIILLTSAIGEAGVIFTGPRLLSKKVTSNV